MGSAGTLTPHMVNGDLDYDVLIIGAGLSGMFSLIRMRELGLRAKILEAGTGEGGTWYWWVALLSLLLSRSQH